jgi:hypothetical protein
MLFATVCHNFLVPTQLFLLPMPNPAQTVSQDLPPRRMESHEIWKEVVQRPPSYEYETASVCAGGPSLRDGCPSVLVHAATDSGDADGHIPLLAPFMKIAKLCLDLSIYPNMDTWA